MGSRYEPTLLLCLALGAASASAKPPSAATSQDLALIRAAERGDVASVRTLLGQGAAVDARDAAGQTALMRAAATGDEAVVAALVEARSDVDAANRNGLTALTAAAAEGRLQVVPLLLAAGADPDRRHRAWGTALDIAEAHRQIELVRLLREHGARGSGKSIGDTVCVRPWSGEGYCGTVEDRDGPRFRLEIVRLVGCAKGCAAREDCSAGKVVGGSGTASMQAGDVVEVPGACLTDTHAGDIQ